MVLFKDIGKPSSDLLTRDYVHSKVWEVAMRNNRRSPLFTLNSTLSPAGAFDTAVSAKLQLLNGACLTEVKRGMSGAGFVDVQHKGLAKGLTLGVRAETKSGKSQADLDISAEFRRAVDDSPSVGDALHAKLSVSPITGAWLASGVAGYRDEGKALYSGGVQLSGAPDIRSLKYSLGAEFKCTSDSHPFSVTLKTAEADAHQLGKFIANIHCASHSSRFSELGAEMQHNRASGKTTATIGGMWDLSSDKDTSIKLRVSQDAKVAAAITHKFGSNFTGIFGAEFDCCKGVQSEVKYGMKLNFAA